MSSSTTSEVKPVSVNIASFNIACARRDEENCALIERLNAVQEMIREVRIAKEVDIFCLQEIRGTGGMTPFQVIDYIRGGLHSLWEFSDAVENSYPRAFHRTLFWDSTKFFHLGASTTRIPNDEKPERPSMFVTHGFARIGSKDEHFLFAVIHCHAPMDLPNKKKYWKAVELEAKWFKNVIIVGDMNKFPEHHVEYKKHFFTADLEDKVGLERQTFHSFPWGSKPDGTPWKSCLDAIITHPSTPVEVAVFSTISGYDINMKNEKRLRPSDHFLVVANVGLKEPQSSFDERKADSAPAVITTTTDPCGGGVGAPSSTVTVLYESGKMALLSQSGDDHVPVYSDDCPALAVDNPLLELPFGGMGNYEDLVKKQAEWIRTCIKEVKFVFNGVHTAHVTLSEVLIAENRTMLACRGYSVSHVGLNSIYITWKCSGSDTCHNCEQRLVPKEPDSPVVVLAAQKPEASPCSATSASASASAFTPVRQDSSSSSCSCENGVAKH